MDSRAGDTRIVGQHRAPGTVILLLVGSALLASTVTSGEISDPPDLVAGAVAFPVGLAAAPDGRLFYTEKATGNIRIIEFTEGGPVLLPAPLATVPNVNGSGEGGLLGIVVDPGWGQTPWLYVYYTADTPNGTRNHITRYWVDGNRTTMNETILAGLGGGILHNGGAMAFGPDGKLYVVVGETWMEDLAQNLSSPHGKVLRLERDGSIPADNPFPGSPVFTWGHRNMYGVAFNPHTGQPYITENGNTTHDEVNLLMAGANYGWPNVTGLAKTPPFADPIWNSTTTIAPTGLVFSTARYPAGGLVDLIFGDWNTGTLRRLVLAAPNYDAVVAEDVLAAPRVGITALTMRSTCQLIVAVHHSILSYNLCKEESDLPRSRLAYNRTSQWETFLVGFNATGSASSELGGPLEFQWDFGDGARAQGEEVNHSWSSSGDYLVHLFVKENGTNFNVSAVLIRIRGLDERLPPEARVTVSSAEAIVGNPVIFDASNSTGYESAIVEVRWSFSDGASAAGPVVVHTFSDPGLHNATVTVQDETGLEGEANTQVTVRHSPSFRTSKVSVELVVLAIAIALAVTAAAGLASRRES